MTKPNVNRVLEWDDEVFRSRVTAIAESQGRRLDEVCITAGLAHDTLIKTQYKGRNINTILALARSLKVPATVLMFGGEVEDPIDSAALRRLGLLAHVTAHLYASLAERDRPTNPEIDRVMRLVLSLIDPAEPPEPT